MEVGVGRAVEVYIRGTGLRIIEEMEIVIANGHMRDQFAMKKVIGRGCYSTLCDDLLRAQAIEIVFEFDFFVGFTHLLELSANRPFVSPATIIQGL